MAAQYSRRQLQLQHVPAARAAADAAPLAGAGAGHGPKESEAAEGAPAATAGAAAAEAAEDGEAAEKHVGLMCSFQLEQLLAELAGRGIRLAPQAQQEAALAALVADVEQLATRIVSSTSAAVAALHQKLAAHMPQQATHAGQWGDAPVGLVAGRLQGRVRRCTFLCTSPGDSHYYSAGNGLCSPPCNAQGPPLGAAKWFASASDTRLTSDPIHPPTPPLLQTWLRCWWTVGSRSS